MSNKPKPKPIPITKRRKSKRSEKAWDHYEALIEAFGKERPEGKKTQELIDEIRES